MRHYIETQQFDFVKLLADFINRDAFHDYFVRYFLRVHSQQNAFKNRNVIMQVVVARPNHLQMLAVILP